MEMRWRWRWAHLLLKLGWRTRRMPTWGAESPAILGVCGRCGAVVLKGWHRYLPDGLICQRCDHKGEK